MITLCDESKDNLHTPLWQWILDDNKYITSWQWFLYHDLHTIYYKEHDTRCKYKRTPNQSLRRIDFLTYTKSKSQRPFHSQVWRISLTSSTPTHLQIEATRIDFPREPSGTPLESPEEEGTLDFKLRTNFKKTEHRHKWMVSHLTLSDKLDALYSDFTLVELRAGSDGSYKVEVEMSS